MYGPTVHRPPFTEIFLKLQIVTRGREAWLGWDPWVGAAASTCSTSYSLTADVRLRSSSSTYERDPWRICACSDVTLHVKCSGV